MKFLVLVFCLGLLACANSNTKIGYKGFGGESVSQDLLDRYAPKPLKASQTLKIETMNEVRTPYGSVLSEDGKIMAVNWSVTGVTQVWKVPGPGKYPIQMTGGADATFLKGITYDKKYFIVTRDHKGNEFPGLYIQPISGGALQEVFSQKQVLVSYVGQSSDGKKLYFMANPDSKTKFGVYEYSIELKTKKLIAGGPGYWWLSDIDDARGLAILGHAINNTASEFFLLNLKTGEKRPIVGQGEKEKIEVAFSKKPGVYLVLTNKLSDVSRLYTFKDGKFLRPITPEMKFPVSSFEIDHRRKRILYGVNESGYIRLHAMSASNYKKIALPVPTSGLLHSYKGGTTKNGRFSIINLSYHNRPTVSYVYDWKKKSLGQWTQPSHPELDPEKFHKWSLESYPSEDGVNIPMFVRRPDHCIKKTCPVIVIFHGGPEGQSQPSFSTGTELLVQAGFVIAMPNVRGSSGFGKKWLHADNGRKRLKVITDIRAASTYIKKNWQFDGVVPKVGVMGGSYGGYSTLIAMSMFAGSYDAGVSIVGMSSLVTFLQNTADHRRYLRESEYGYLAKDMDVLKKLSPSTYIDQVRDPLLIIQGATDPRVPAWESIQFQQALEEKGLKSNLILYPDEGHGIRKRKNRTSQKGHTLNFFKKHLM